MTRPEGRAYRSFAAFGGSRKVSGHLFPGSFRIVRDAIRQRLRMFLTVADER